jgi:hypothetical protein
MFADLGINKDTQMFLQLDVRAFFVRASQPAVSGHIGR